ncbi:MAG: hypothetical protein IJH04_02450 [Eggerthellaceae bacterium]|nr:hypothetical protein [Eggerthellaceae bacterium]
MNATQLNELLLEAFPELAEKFEDYTSWQDGMETGCFLTYEDLLLPFAREALDTKDDEKLARIGTFIEKIMTIGDDYAGNVATVGLLEGLKADGNDTIRQYLGTTSLAEYDSMAY